MVVMINSQYLKFFSLIRLFVGRFTWHFYSDTIYRFIFYITFFIGQRILSRVSSVYRGFSSPRRQNIQV